MAYDRSALVARTRQIVHEVMSVPANYEHPAQPGVSTALTVRWHDRRLLQGNMIEAGWPDVQSGIDRVIFNKTELGEKGVVLATGGRLTLTDACGDSIVLTLDNQEADAGSVGRVWLAVKP